MNRIFITGDVHGEIIPRLSRQNFPIGKDLDETDLFIVAGDFGVIWNTSDTYIRREQYALKWIEENCPFTVLVVGGNHDNWDRLRALPRVEKFGVSLGEISSNVFFVPNGTIIEHGGKKIFCMGGAMSTDRGGFEPEGFYPEEGRSWWRSEIPTKEDMDFALDNLEKHNHKVDIIVSHTMPSGSVEEFCVINGYHQMRINDPTARFLGHVKYETLFNEWYCGHFHKEGVYDGVTCLYETIIDLENNETVSKQKFIPHLWD